MKPVQGEKFLVTETVAPRVTIVADLVREHFANDPATLAKLTATTDVATIKATRCKGEKAKFVMPNLANATPEGLADHLGEVREQIADLKKLEGIYKDALLARARALEADEVAMKKG